MTKVLLDDSNLSAIGNAIREKTGSTDTYKPREMADAIAAIKGGDPNCNGRHIPDEALTITGNCSYKFADDNMNWFIEECGDEITTKDISNGSCMFSGSNKLTSIPFDLNFSNSNYYSMGYMFNGCEKLKEIGDINNAYPSDMTSMFSRCVMLRQLPTFNNLNLDRIHSFASASISSMFNFCCSLRSIPEEFLKQLKKPNATSYIFTVFDGGFRCCYALDEIRGLNPQTGAIASNMFSNTFNDCYRLKDIIFAVQEDGTPYTVSWKNQTIDLTKCVGHPQNSGGESLITRDYNSGITTDKAVRNAEDYAALKNDPDWYAMDASSLAADMGSAKRYSRYNHDSAVNTINSLPDTSAYGTNTIKFQGVAGELTDGGAINTLTETEIAVAAAKGWTVTFS